MALIFSNDRYPSTRKEVREVISIIEQDPNTFLLISRIFNTKRKCSAEPEFLHEVDAIIETTLNSPRYSIEDSLRTNLEHLLKSIYRNDSEKLNNIKAEILESVVYRYGPYTANLDREKVYMEPTILDGEVLVGNDSKIDSVFYTSDNKPLEFVECKANIANVIPWNLPRDRLKRADFKKVDYLERAYNYLTKRFSRPEIYIACYNTNYDDQLENVHKNWGLQFIKFLNPEEIHNGMIHCP